MRIVIIRAKRPGTGAFRRLVAAILKAGLVPVVVSPLPRMKAILERWQWVHKAVGSSYEDFEDQWRPPVPSLLWRGSGRETDDSD